MSQLVSSFGDALTVDAAAAMRSPCQRPRTADVAVIRLDIVEDLAALEAEWRVFETVADCTVFQTWAWLAKWQRHIGATEGTRPVVVTGRDAASALLFILPLAIERRGLVRRLTWLGGALCDYNGPMLGPDFTARVGGEFPTLWRRVLRAITERRDLRFDLIDLAKMTETVGAQRNPFFSLPVIANPSGAYVATLGQDWETFYAARRSGPTRKKERKQLKQLGEHGAIRFASAGGTPDADRILSVLMEQKSRSFARLGVANHLARDGHVAFYRDLVNDPEARFVHLSHLDVGDSVAASSIGLRFRDSYYLILSSYNDGPISRFGPGRADLHELIRFAIAEGFKRFDFTIGDEPYKRDWADIVVRPHDHLAGRTLLGHAVVGGTLAFREIKRTIKQTPVLWRAFSRLRSLKSALTGRARNQAASSEETAD